MVWIRKELNNNMTGHSGSTAGSEHLFRIRIHKDMAEKHRTLIAGGESSNR